MQGREPVEDARAGEKAEAEPVEDGFTVSRELIVPREDTCCIL